MKNKDDEVLMHENKKALAIKKLEQTHIRKAKALLKM